jgi:hypothetical protein
MAIRVNKGVYPVGLGEQRLLMPPLVLWRYWSAPQPNRPPRPCNPGLGVLSILSGSAFWLKASPAPRDQRVINSSRRGTKRPFKRWRCLEIAKHGANAVKRFLALSMGAMIVGAAAAMAATETMNTIPSNSVTVTDWYQQNVYDTQNNKIGSTHDVLVSPDGKVNALILSANGKDVAVNFDSVKKTMKDNNVYLIMNTRTR